MRFFTKVISNPEIRKRVVNMASNVAGKAKSAALTGTMITSGCFFVDPALGVTTVKLAAVAVEIGIEETKKAVNNFGKR